MACAAPVGTGAAASIARRLLSIPPPRTLRRRRRLRLISTVGWRDAPRYWPRSSPSPSRRCCARRQPAPRRRAPGRGPASSFWLLSLSFVAGAFATTPISVLLVPVLIDSGHSAAFAASIAAVVGS
jgi:hypothetical protein